MNTFSKTSFRQKLYKCAVMIIILLEAACAANFAKLGDEPDDETAPKPSKLAANGAGGSFICSMDIPGEISARPKAQPTTVNHSPEPIPSVPVPDEETELRVATCVALLPIIEFLIALSRCDGCFNFWGE